MRSGSDIGRRLEVYTWNFRIELWYRLPQFRYLFGVMEDRRYVAVSLLVMVFNLPMVVVQCLAGFVLLSPLPAVGTGGFAGSIIGPGRGRRFFMYAAVAAVFEFGAFAISGALGMMVGVSWLLQGAGFVEAVVMVVNNTGGYTLLPVLFLAANGLLEAAGPCF